LNYALCFGVEMHIINTVPFYFSLTYNLETTTAGMIGSLYGVMNVFARSAGGYISDKMFIKYKMKGKF
jgi:MFS transporter, NNP family, nitrate/nitrite transporter